MQWKMKLWKHQIQLTKSESKWFRKKIPEAATLIHINQANQIKRNLEKNEDIDKKNTKIQMV